MGWSSFQYLTNQKASTRPVAKRVVRCQNFYNGFGNSRWIWSKKCQAVGIGGYITAPLVAPGGRKCDNVVVLVVSRSDHQRRRIFRNLEGNQDISKPRRQPLNFPQFSDLNGVNFICLRHLWRNLNVGSRVKERLTKRRHFSQPTAEAVEV